MRRINKDEEHLGKLRDFYAKNKIIPRLAVIGELTGMNVSSAFVMVNRLKKNGYLESYGTQLQPGPRFFAATLLDTVQAGSPMSATDNQPVEIDILGRLLKDPSKSRLFKVSGKSMVDAGLLDGDYVIVQIGGRPRLGDIVVAQVEGGYTVKKWAKDKEGVILRSANAANKDVHDVRPVEDDKTIGVVTGSFRGYNLRHLR